MASGTDAQDEELRTEQMSTVPDSETSDTAAAIRERGMTDTKSARCPYCCCLLDGIAAHIDGCKCRPLPYERGEKA